MDREVKKILLHLLENDVEVIDAVKRVVDSENSKLGKSEKPDFELERKIEEFSSKAALFEQQNNELLKELSSKNKELKRKNDELKQKEEEVEMIRSQVMDCEKRKEEAFEKYNNLKLRYCGLDMIYSKYLDLGEAVIQKMERILNPSSDINGSAELFMAYGIQENNIIALWESIATNYDLYNSQGKTKDLIDIFEYFLKLYKEISFKIIQIEWPSIGDLYDERKHTRTTSSSAVGRIEMVVLPGFCIGKNVTKKSLVVVK